MLLTEKDEYWMQIAFKEAEKAAQNNEVPVGAVLVSKGEILAQACNSPIAKNDPTAHAEILVIQKACQSINNYRLPEDSTLYVTLEPCTMCVGALIHARVKNVIFATPEPKAGALISSRKLLDEGYFNHKFTFSHGCLQEQCATQLSQFFKERRAQKKAEKAK